MSRYVQFDSIFPQPAALPTGSVARTFLMKTFLSRKIEFRLRLAIVSYMPVTNSRQVIPTSLMPSARNKPLLGCFVNLPVNNSLRADNIKLVLTYLSSFTLLQDDSISHTGNKLGEKILLKCDIYHCIHPLLMIRY